MYSKFIHHGNFFLLYNSFSDIPLCIRALSPPFPVLFNARNNSQQCNLRLTDTFSSQIGAAPLFGVSQLKPKALSTHTMCGKLLVVKKRGRVVRTPFLFNTSTKSTFNGVYLNKQEHKLFWSMAMAINIKQVGYESPSFSFFFPMHLSLTRFFKYLKKIFSSLRIS